MASYELPSLACIDWYGAACYSEKSRERPSGSALKLFPGVHMSLTIGQH